MKRIVICCDGTWNEPDMVGDNGRICPTNVAKLASLVAPTADIDGRPVEQRLFYSSGVGTSGGIFARLAGGAFGDGLDANLLSAYRYLVDVYDGANDADEIFLFGFSRGAFTARSLAGLINNVGILRPEHRGRLSEAYALYRSRDPVFHPREHAAKFFRQAFAWRDRTPIRCVGVWDTVGALGIPSLVGVHWPKLLRTRQFHDTNLGSAVQHAYHALAIDERRRPFKPTLWTQSAANAARGQILEQAWFAGVHTDIGGGYSASGLSDVALAWMLERAARSGLALNPIAASSIGMTVTPDPLIDLHDTLSGVYRLSPIRRAVCEEPQRLAKADAEPERAQEASADSTCETVDPSVRQRWRARHDYRPPNLAKFAARWNAAETDRD